MHVAWDGASYINFLPGFRLFVRYWVCDWGAIIRDINALLIPITELYTQTNPITAHPMKTKAPSTKPFGVTKQPPGWRPNWTKL